MNHRDLVNITKNPNNTILWLMEKNAIINEMTCNCFVQQKMSLLQKNSKLLWRCGRCDALKSVFYGTIIYKSKLAINKIIDLIYFWCKDNKQNETSIEIQTKSKKTCLEWYKKLQKLSYYIMKKESRKKIGGINKIVEIDESKFSKRKYNVGRIVRSVWVVGGIDVETGDSFFVEVIKRDAHTLSQIILDNVGQGSIIYTDCWRGYINISNLEFLHYTVNHTENFINPVNFCNTQMIEGLWSVYKRKFRARFIGQKTELSLYFAEFAFKIKYKNQAFEKIIENLKDSLNKIDF